jgi:hypothetical protein
LEERNQQLVERERVTTTTGRKGTATAAATLTVGKRTTTATNAGTRQGEKEQRLQQERERQKAVSIDERQRMEEHQESINNRFPEPSNRARHFNESATRVRSCLEENLLERHKIWMLIFQLVTNSIISKTNSNGENKLEV